MDREATSEDRLLEDTREMIISVSTGGRKFIIRY